MIKKVGNIDIGIIGLSSLSTPYTTFPAYVEQYDFTGYEEAIDRYPPILQEEGAAIILIILLSVCIFIVVAKRFFPVFSRWVCPLKIGKVFWQPV